MLGLTIGLSTQTREVWILVNAVARTDRYWAIEVAVEADFPLGIVGPDPIAHGCLYLARESGAWMSGSVLNVSGGRWRGCTIESGMETLSLDRPRI